MATDGRHVREAGPRLEPAGRRAERRAQRAALGRNQLLDAAEEVFGRRGYRDATLRDVAQLAEFSVGSVYSFFSSKEDLYAGVFARRGAAFVAALEDAVAHCASREQLRAVVETEVGFFRRYPAFGRLYLRSARVGGLPSAGDAVDRVVSTHLERAMAIQTAVIERGQTAGRFRHGDATVLARMLSAMVSTYQSLDPEVVGSGGPELGGPGLPLPTLLDIVDAAFGAGTGAAVAPGAQ